MVEGVRFLFVGDISLGGKCADEAGENPELWVEPFRCIRPLFQAADLRIGNLESPLHLGAKPRSKKNLLGAPPESVAALASLGFTVLSLGNNHITDQGGEGIIRTRELLESRGIGCFGAGHNEATAAQPAFVKTKGLSFAILGYAVVDEDVGAEAATGNQGGCVPFSLHRVEQDIRAAKGRADHVVVSVHWGYQYDCYPYPEQIATARQMVDVGATVVYGHHPHVLQGIERYKHGLILYSMGNFFFPSFVRTDGVRYRFPREALKSAAVVCDIGPAGVNAYHVLPLLVGSGCRIRLLKGRRAIRASRSLALRSRALGSPTFASTWGSHHFRTERSRNRREKALRSRAKIAARWRAVCTRGLAGSLRGLQGRQAKLFCRFLARLTRFFPA